MVAHSFEREVLGAATDVLVGFHAPWCQHCNGLDGGGRPARPAPLAPRLCQPPGDPRRQTYIPLREIQSPCAGLLAEIARIAQRDSPGTRPGDDAPASLPSSDTNLAPGVPPGAAASEDQLAPGQPWGTGGGMSSGQPLLVAELDVHANDMPDAVQAPSKSIMIKYKV